ncbi:RND transporter [Spirochaetota bacterium]
MDTIIEFIRKMDWSLVIILCLTLGLAPFNPPHIWEKINMLLKGTLSRPIDWFDLFFHGIPWILLILKIITIKR